MIIDANAWLGHWPFRPLRHNDVPGLLGLMDRAGIDMAVVASVHGVLYRNVQRANEELAEQVAGQRDRLIPFATLNPNYPGWQRDLRLCREMGIRGLRLYPIYHGYNLTDAPALELINAATEMGWPVQLPQRIEDVRQRHWLDTERNLTVEEAGAVVAACPRTSFIFLNALGLPPGVFLGAGGSRSQPIVTDISRVSAVLRDDMRALIASVGVGALVFGTGMPFNYPEPALLKMRVLRASEEDKQRIYSDNLRAILEP